MNRLACLRSIALAGFLGIAALLSPQAASAITVNPGTPLDVQFLAGADLNQILNNSYDHFALQFDYGVGGTGANFTAQLFDAGSGSALADSVAVTVPASTSGISAPFNLFASNQTIVGPFYAHIVASNPFNLTSATLLAYDGSGAVTAVPDAVPAPTPIPASLPLFLAGGLLLYGFARRDRSGSASVCQAA